MTVNENKLIKLIREQKNRDKAMVIAIKTILLHLKQHESSAIPKAVDFRESV